VSEAAAERPQDSVGHRIVRAMFIVIFFQLFWKFGGFIITLLVGRKFGSGPESDAYFFVTESVVFLLQTMCLKVFIPLVVPLFKEEHKRGGEEAAWRLANTVLSLTVVVLALLTVAGMVFAPQIVRLFAEGFDEQRTELSTRLVRWMFPGVFAMCLATVTYAILNSYNIFGYASAGDAVQKIIWAGVFFAAALSGLALTRLLDALAVAFIISAVAMVLTHLFGLRSKLAFFRLGLPGLSSRRVGIELAILCGHLAFLGVGLWAVELLRPALPSARVALALQQAVLVVAGTAYLLLLGWRARGRATSMGKFAALAVPLLFGILFAKYRDVLTNLFASFTGTGVLSDLKYARKVGEAPNTLIIAALGYAILPHLCELATGRRWKEFADVMTRTIRGIVVLFVPLAALIVVLRRPIIQLLFESGDWSDYHLDRAGDALGLYILSLPFFAIENPIQQSFFAMQRMWAPTIVGFISTGFHILFLFVGIEWLGYGYFAVVAAVYVFARAFKEIILLCVMRYYVKILPWRPTCVFLAKAAVITAGVAAAAYGTQALLQRFVALEPYRPHEVMIDTFNVELRDWEGDNVDEFRIVSGEKDKEVLREAFGGLLKNGQSPVDGQNALMARYRRSPRRVASLQRDLSTLALQRVRRFLFEATCSEDAELTLELVREYGAPFRHRPLRVTAGKREQVEVKVADFGVDRALLREVVALWIRDTTRVERVGSRSTTLVLDNFKVKLYPGGEQNLDTFEPSTQEWVTNEPLPRRNGTHHPPVADTGERAGGPELALFLARGRGPRTAERFLDPYALGGCNVLTFKARASASTKKLKLSLASGYVTPGAPDTKDSGALPPRRPADYDEPPSDIHYGEGGEWEATVEIKASDKRMPYKVRLSDFKGQGERKVDMKGYLRLALEVPEGVDLWLDNVAFVREPKGQLGGVSAVYELLKLVLVAVPSLAALLVFVVLLFVLRVEEGREAWAWFRERGLRRLAGKRSGPPAADADA
jgi:putative peptidoglycan lipid II flippase